MATSMAWRVILSFLLSLTCALQVAAQAGASASVSTPPLTSAPANSSNTGTATTGAPATTASAPDVYLNVPTLSVGRIELDVDDLSADINLAANVAQLVSINAGVQLSIQKVNLTIADVSAELDLVVRLGNLVEIVNRVFESLDLNPLLLNTIGNVTDLLDDIVGEVDGLLGSITQGGTTLKFIVDNLGNIVQEVGGVSSIVGNYLQNMTLVAGSAEDLGQGLVRKQYQYSPLNALVNIVFNKAGQIVQAVVAKAGGATSGGGSSSKAASSSLPSASAVRM